MAKSKATPCEILAQILIGIMGCRQVGPRICHFDLIPWDIRNAQIWLEAWPLLPSSGPGQGFCSLQVIENPQFLLGSLLRLIRNWGLGEGGEDK